MNSAQFHLFFSHFPIVGLAFAILINLYALFTKSHEAAKLSLWFYFVLGIFALTAYLTGDGAEKIMETYPGITEETVEPHENIALFFFIGLMITTGIAMTGLYITKTKENLLKKFTVLLLIMGLLLGILAGITGSTGGAIRHTEIKQGIYLNRK
jgi:uncharacterized membrane protein